MIFLDYYVVFTLFSSLIRNYYPYSPVFNDINSKPVHAFYRFRVHRLHSAEGEYPRVLQKKETITVTHCKVQVVNYDDHRDITLSCNIADNMEHLVLVIRVKAARRFVEQQQLRFLSESPCQHDLLRLAAGQLRNVP